MNTEFLSTVSVIAPDPPASRKLYVETFGLPLEGHGGDYLHSEQIASTAPESWRQTVARLQSPEGAIVGISYAPVLHDND